jgi:hypothetical protein
METTLTSFARVLTVGAMLGLSAIILLGKWLDRQSHNGVFYGGMLVITLVIGGTLLLALSGY